MSTAVSVFPSAVDAKSLFRSCEGSERSWSAPLTLNIVVCCQQRKILLGTISLARLSQRNLELLARETK